MLRLQRPASISAGLLTLAVARLVAAHLLKVVIENQRLFSQQLARPVRRWRTAWSWLSIHSVTGGVSATVNVQSLHHQQGTNTPSGMRILPCGFGNRLRCAPAAHILRRAVRLETPCHGATASQRRSREPAGSPASRRRGYRGHDGVPAAAGATPHEHSHSQRRRRAPPPGAAAGTGALRAAAAKFSRRYQCTKFSVEVSANLLSSTNI